MNTNKKINRFYEGGPTREMTPSEAAALNKMLNNSQYMIAVGDSPDDPAYLSTDYLEPAVVKAFNSNEDYNRYYGEQFGKQIAKKRDEVANSIMRALEYTPFVGDGVDIANTIVSINKGDYSQAAVLAGLSLLPNTIESIGKVVTKPFKNLLGLNSRKTAKTATEKIKALLKRFPKGMDSSSHFSASLKERLLKEGVDHKLLTDDNLKKMTYLRSQDILESVTPPKFAARESSSGINMYNLYNTADGGVTQVGYINAVPNPTEKSGRIAMVENVTQGSRKPVKGVSELGYNTVIKDLGASENGRVLLHPESTIPVLDKYKDKDVIGNYGVWYTNGSQTLGNPVYRLNTPTYDVPIKYLDDFSVEGLDDSGMFLFDFTKGPLLKNGGKINKLLK